MKKLIFTAVIVLVIATGSPLFAQNIPEGHESEFYYLNVSIEMIFPHRAGYVVMYRANNELRRVYLPLEWFTAAAAKGEIINLPRGPAWPSMSVYYKDGEFSHVRLYVHPVRTHQTWGVMPQNANIDSRFENVDTIQLF